MTTLKTPEELVSSLSLHGKITEQHARDIIEMVETRDKTTAGVLCDLLEGKRATDADIEPRGGMCVEFADGFNDGLYHAQALIRQTLDPISSNER